MFAAILILLLLALPRIVHSIGEALGRTVIVKVFAATESKYPDEPYLTAYLSPVTPVTRFAFSDKSRALILLAGAIKDHEGFYPGSIAYDNNNPGNLRSWPTQSGSRRGFAYFSSYAIGWQALLDLLNTRCQSNPTLYQLMSWYAPASDNNDPYLYASIIAKSLDISINEKIANIYCF